MKMSAADFRYTLLDRSGRPLRGGCRGTGYLCSAWIRSSTLWIRARISCLAGKAGILGVKGGLFRKKDGDVLIGWMPEESDTTVSVMEDMLVAGKLTVVQRKDIESMALSAVSLMPEGLINMLKEDEIMDLVAYLLSGGDSTQKMFQ